MINTTVSSFLLSNGKHYHHPNAVTLETEKKDPLCLKVAIKAYKDKMLTGLTDEDKEEIKKRIQAYLQEHTVETEEEMAAFLAFVKSLYAEVGYPEDRAKQMVNEILHQMMAEPASTDAPAHLKLMNKPFRKPDLVILD